MPRMTGLTRSHFLLGAAGVALPARTRVPGPLAALAAAMRGPVLLPGSTAYGRIAPVFNGRYAGVRPAAVAQPLDARDLAAALRIARARSLDPNPGGRPQLHRRIDGGGWRGAGSAAAAWHQAAR